MRRALRWSILLVAAGCKPAQQVQRQPPPAPIVRPAWVDSRPVTSAYYVGIGIAPKNRPDFQEAAKQNALNDLASEISVTVEGNSLLYTLDTRGQFTDSYTSTVRTRTSQQLEGFELVDSWDSGNELWTYYRLRKAEHARLQAEKKRAATTQATDLHGRSRSALAAGDLPGAFDLELRALIALRDHWGEADRVEVEGRSVVLANELYGGLQQLTSGLTLGSLPERCVLEPANGHRRELLIRARHGTAGALRDMAQVPLTATYPGSAGKVTVNKRTDADGHARITVEGVSLDAATPELLVRLDLDALVNGSGDPALVRTLTAGLSVPELHVPIDLRMPRVLLKAEERAYGTTLANAGVAVALREELARRGFRFVDREAESDLVIVLSADTREGGTTSGFYTAFLDITLTCTDRRTGELVHQTGRQGMKGVQLAYDKAALEAYKKGAQDLRKDLVPALITAIL
jgi:hypothetical protein